MEDVPRRSSTSHSPPGAAAGTSTGKNSPVAWPSTPTQSTMLLDTHSPLGSPLADWAPPLAPFARTGGARDSRQSVHSFYSDSPYGEPGTRVSSIVDKWSLGPDPRLWGTEIAWDTVEDDDELHRPEKESRVLDDRGSLLSRRGVANLGCLGVLILGLLALFMALPITKHFSQNQVGTFGAFGIGGTNSTGQVPVFASGFALIDPDTPQSAYTKPSWMDNGEMELVFSDEFNVDDRTFYPGDDPFWEAVDLHYWPTGNVEWYDPAAVTTGGGSLAITFSATPEHKLQYRGGMIQSWNKFCFTGGYIETSVMMPGLNNLAGMWPAIWTMGNLGRAGYGASTDGTWPYTYDACDVGTVANQTINGEPAAALTGNDNSYGGHLSALPGQRLSRCTCAGDADQHPGPRHSDGTFVGRSAPEIDIFEQQVGTVQKGAAEISQSGQWAPFNLYWDWKTNHTTDFTIYNQNVTVANGFGGTGLQQATSYISEIDQNCFQQTGQCYSIYGFEYVPGFDTGYITWISNNQKAWTITSAAMGGDPRVGISQRPIPMEPMYIIVNLGMSKSFVPNPDPAIFSTFPVTMFVDYIRVYQPKGSKNIGCDPPGFPTTDYINKYSEAYTNPNLTIWGTTTNPYMLGFNQSVPRNSLIDQC